MTEQLKNRRAIVALLTSCLAACLSAAETVRVPLDPTMIRSSSERADFSGLVDEQAGVGDPPAGKPSRAWHVNSQFWKQFPYSATLDLGRERHLASIWIFDTYNTGEVAIATGEPGRWTVVTNYSCDRYMTWVQLPLPATSRYLQIELKSPGATIAELVLYEYTPEGHRAFVERQAAEAQRRAEREAALAQSHRERAAQPWIELPPFGRVRLVDAIDCGAPDPGHGFTESPAGASRVEPILGRPCRVLRKTPGEAAYMAFRLGRWKLLAPGRAYVLAIDYPEDEPRSWLVMNGGNETTRGFHTGNTIGDALHPRYVQNNPESVRVPLSGRYETWTLLFHLHDRFPDLQFLRGEGERPLTAEDGFTVAIGQFSARDIPASQGAAVAGVRLYEVQDENALAQPIRFPPEPLPRRHLFWREEMADGVIQSERATHRGVTERLDWYRFKARQMRFLGVNTFSKDLLEFGACQHWDSSPHGGNDWVYFNAGLKNLWGEIVREMGRAGFGVLPYYEYAGSKGRQGLGPQRRCRPLTRDDAYTHIAWVESANADITDPDTWEDFQKMLDLTVVRLKDAARFEGIWLRPRWQLPMSFADATRRRFADEANGGRPVSRADLIGDPARLKAYEAWWFGKRRAFLVAMRDYLRAHGVTNATVLFTAEPSESGTSFPTWEKRLVTDDPEFWKPVLTRPEHILDNRPITPVPWRTVVDQSWYATALEAAPLNWGNWEVHHASPPADPARYRSTDGVLLTHCFNRLYTVGSPRSFDAFRGPSGLALVRHYALNEDMMSGPDGQAKLGYFVADIERAGPYCTMAEAMAVAQGDPTHIGYLLGNNFGRGFPQYVREFNANFLALPALPSTRLSHAVDDPEVVVRSIATEGHGTYLAVVNTGFAAKSNVVVRLPKPGRVVAVAHDRILAERDATVELTLRPHELRTLHLTPR